jgi:hypothetical protein
MSSPSARGRPPSLPHDTRAGPEGNSRLTASIGALLLVLLAIEGFTVLSVRRLFVLHVFLGFVLLPPFLLKVGSTVWRAGRYYLANEEYRRRGPPPLVLRLLGPVLVVLTGVLLGSGVAAVFAPISLRGLLLTVHEVSFVLWFGAMAIHVLGHLTETASLALRDFSTRTRRHVGGASARQWALAASAAAGLVLAAVLTPHVGVWLHPTSAR